MSSPETVGPTDSTEENGSCRPGSTDWSAAPTASTVAPPTASDPSWAWIVIDTMFWAPAKVGSKTPTMVTSPRFRGWSAAR